MSGSSVEQELTVAVMHQGQHQIAPTFVGDSIHQTDDEKASEAMTGGSLLGGPGMTEMPGLQAALAAASAAMQAAGQSMPPPAPLTQHQHHTLSQVGSAPSASHSHVGLHHHCLCLPVVLAGLFACSFVRDHTMSPH